MAGYAHRMVSFWSITTGVNCSTIWRRPTGFPSAECTGTVGLFTLAWYEFGASGLWLVGPAMRGKDAGGAGHGLLFAQQHPHPLADLVGWPALLENAGHPIIQAAVLFAADYLFVVHAHSSL